MAMRKFVNHLVMYGSIFVYDNIITPQNRKKIRVVSSYSNRHIHHSSKKSLSVLCSPVISNISYWGVAEHRPLFIIWFTFCRFLILNSIINLNLTSTL